MGWWEGRVLVSEAKKYGLEFTLLGRKFTLNHFPITLLENKQRKGKDQGRGRKVYSPNSHFPLL